MSENYLENVFLEEIELRDVSVDDSEFLAEVYYSTRIEEFSMLGWDETQLKTLLEMQHRSQKQSYSVQFPEASNLIIFTKNEKVGRIIVNKTASELRLVDIALLPKFRNLGVGTKIITNLIEEATNTNLSLTLHVARSNQAAIRLYQKLGFQIKGENDMYLFMDWRKTVNLGESNV